MKSNIEHAKEICGAVDADYRWLSESQSLALDAKINEIRKEGTEGKR